MKTESRIQSNYEKCEEKEIQTYCLFCNNSIYVKDIFYCNIFCNNADLYGTHQALFLWTNDNEDENN